LFRSFEQNRTSEQETFLTFIRRHSIDDLRKFAGVRSKES
jgi:hypothetical protein